MSIGGAMSNRRPLRLPLPPIVLPRPGLLGSFAVLSALPIVALGVVLAHQLADHVRRHAIASATETAVLVARMGVEPQLSRSDVVFGLTPANYARLDRSLRGSGVMGSKVAKIELW